MPRIGTDRGRRIAALSRPDDIRRAPAAEASGAREVVATYVRRCLRSRIAGSSDRASRLGLGAPPCSLRAPRIQLRPNRLADRRMSSTARDPFSSGHPYRAAISCLESHALTTARYLYISRFPRKPGSPSPPPAGSRMRVLACVPCVTLRPYTIGRHGLAGANVLGDATPSVVAPAKRPEPEVAPRLRRLVRLDGPTALADDPLASLSPA